MKNFQDDNIDNNKDKKSDDLFLKLHITEEELNVYAKDVEISRLPSKKPNKKKKKFKMLSSFSILFIIISILIFVSWILHWSGVRVDILKDEVITNEEIKPLGIIDIFYLPFKGFQKQAEIIVFILMIGAFINIVVSSKSLESVSQSITRKLKGKEVFAIIPLMIFFGICGTVEGLAEEALGFYMISIPLMLAIGFDVFTGFLIVFLGAGLGVLSSTFNPFLINTATQSINTSSHIAEQFSISDGLVWRIITWFLMMSGGITFVMIRAVHIKKHPQKSVTFSTYEGDKEYFLGNDNEIIKLDWRKRMTLIVFALAFIIMIFYLVNWDSILGYIDDTKDPNFNPGPFYNAWDFLTNKFRYITGMVPQIGSGNMLAVASFFLMSSIILGIINGLGEEGFLKEFMAGAADILSVCFVIGVAASISIILVETNIQGLFNSGLKTTIGSLPSMAKPVVLFLIFLPIAFLIPSTSGFAFSIFPMISGTLIIGTGTDAHFDPVAASGSIQAFSFSSGLLNLFTPTSGVVMGAIAIARMDYLQFLKGMWKILLTLFIACIIFLVVGGAIASTSWGANIA